VIGDELDERVLPSDSGALEPPGGGGMERHSFRAGERLIRDLPDEDVPERVAVGRIRPHEILVHQRQDRLGGRPREIRVERDDAGRPEGPAIDRAELQDPPLDRLKEIKARENGRLDGVRQARQCLEGRRVAGTGADPLDERTHDLAGEERIALRALDDLRDDRRVRGLQQVSGDLGDRVVAQRLEREGDIVAPPPAPPRPAVEELGASERDHEHRHAGVGLHDELDQVEQAVR